MSVGSLSNTSVRVIRRGKPTGLGARTESTVWTGLAMVQPLSGREISQLGKDLENVTTRAYIEGRPNIRVGDIMVAEGLRYHVRAARDIDLRGVFTTFDMERIRD